MLTSIEIENFKGIAKRQRIEFAPLTLLFGANSAGKSTILQALLYLQELVERGNADVDRTELGGQVVELGGFARLVHRHDTERAVVLRTEFKVGKRTPLNRFGRDLAGFPFPDFEDEVESAWLDLTIRFRRSANHRGAVVERAVIGVNEDPEPLVWLEVGATLREGEPLYVRVNLGHPLLGTETRVLEGVETVDPDGSRHTITTPHAPAETTALWESIALPEKVHQQALLGEEGGWGGGAGDGFGLGDGSGFGDGRSLPVFAVARGRKSALPASGEPLRVIVPGDETPEAAVAAEQVRTFLEMVVLGTTAQLASFLRDSPYIGPLRAIPPRGYLYERVGRVASWADGLAAWDLLLADRLTLVERTNSWLRRLQAGCQVVVQELGDGTASAEERAEGHVDKTVRRLLLDTGARSYVLPSEVGAGISQVIPVIVAAIEGRGGLALVEQPEIHVHPALQVGLGDLLIEATGEGNRAFVIETHSEHLILRLLRRIRETTEGELVDGVFPFSEDQLSVLYVEATSEGVRVTRLRVDDRGEFVDRWPKGFFAERMGELL